MNIPITIGDKTAILRSSEYCYELCFKRLQQGLETWTPEKYYSTLTSAFTAIFEMRIRASTAKSLAELKNVIEETREEIRTDYASACLTDEAVG